MGRPEGFRSPAMASSFFLSHFAPTPSLSRCSSENTATRVELEDPRACPVLPSRQMDPNAIERDDGINNHERRRVLHPQLSFLSAALRKSLVMCGGDVGFLVADMDIGSPTDVRHIAHVTFDRFDGFLGLPHDMFTNLPGISPSVSASIFGVSAKSLHCSLDNRGNSIPTILLLMQRRLYSQGGLQAEGIFRINAENSQEVNVRQKLNSGIVPNEIDVHCLACLIKAWFRELPSGVLDPISPEEMKQYNTEECSWLAMMLPPTERELLDWAVNLMADVVEHEHENKMNARNIAMVFAPNMTQVADPLTALAHVEQVMNFLKNLITRTLARRKDLLSSNSTSSSKNNNNCSKLSGTAIVRFRFGSSEKDPLDIEMEDSFLSEIDNNNNTSSVHEKSLLSCFSSAFR